MGQKYLLQNIIKKQNLVIFFIILCLGVFIVSLFFYFSSRRVFKDIKINDTKIKVEIISKASEMRAGLSGRDSLDQNEGILFVYSEKEVKTFWMKGMKFPIDIIWISDDVITGIEKNVLLGGENEKRRSSSEVNKVIELNAGFCDKNDIKKGDKIKIDN